MSLLTGRSVTGDCHRRTGQGGREGSCPPPGFGKLVKFGQMGWEIRAFGGLNFLHEGFSYLNM